MPVIIATGVNHPRDFEGFDGIDKLDLGSNALSILTTWFILLTIGQIALGLLLLTILLGRRRGVKPRPAVLVNLLVMKFLSSTCSCLLYYAGQQLNPRPPYPLCMTQQLLRHGFGPAFITAVFAYVLHIWRIIWRALHRTTMDRTVENVLLFCLPWFTFLVMVLPAAIIGGMEPRRVHRHSRLWYCTVHNNNLGMALQYIVTGIILLTVIFQSWSGIIVYRNRRTAGAAQKEAFQIGQMLRIGGFTLVELLYLAMSATVIRPVGGQDLDLIPGYVEALMGILVFLLFASHEDIIRCWCFWKPIPASPSPSIGTPARAVSLPPPPPPMSQTDPGRGAFSIIFPWKPRHGQWASIASIPRSELERGRERRDEQNPVLDIRHLP